MRDPPSLARFLPKRTPQRGWQKVDDASPRGLYSLTPLTIHANSHGLDDLSPPVKPFALKHDNHSAPDLGLSPHDNDKSSSQLSLVTKTIRPTTSHAQNSPSSGISPSSVVSPITPSSAGFGTPKTMPFFPTASSLVVELPGSILMENGGFPGSAKTIKTVARGYNDQRFSPKLVDKLNATTINPQASMAATTTTSPACPTPPTGRARKSSTVLGRVELEAFSAMPMPTPDPSPVSPKSGGGMEKMREKMLARKERVPNESSSDVRPPSLAVLPCPR